MISRSYIKDTEDKIVLNMIKNNKIGNILPFKINNNEIIYDIDGKISLNDSIGAKTNSKKITEIFNKICIKLEELELYMIDYRSIYLDKNSIYLDQLGEIYFMINPSIKNQNDYKVLFQDLYLNLIIEIDDKVESIIKINNYFNTENYSINGLKKILKNKIHNEIINLDNKEKNEEDNIEEIKNKKKSFRFFDINKILIKRNSKIIQENKI